MPGKRKTPYGGGPAAKKAKLTLMNKKSVTKKNILNKTQKATLRYGRNAAIARNAGIDNVGSYVVSAINLFDPDAQNGDGHQPRGYDQLMSLYDKAYVNTVKIRVHFTPTETTGSAELLAAISIRETSTPVTTIEDMLEYGSKKWTVVGTRDGSGGNVLTYELNPSKWLGRTLRDPGLLSQIGTAPIEDLFFHLNWSVRDAVQTTTSIYFEVVWEATFIEPKLPSIS